MIEGKAEREKQPMPTWTKALAWIVFVLVVIYVGTYGYAWLVLSDARRKFEELGRPMSARELIPPEVADEDNAAVQLASLIDAMRVQDSLDGDMLTQAKRLGFKRKALGDDEFFEQFEILVAHEAFRNAQGLAEGLRSRSAFRLNVDFDERPDMWIMPERSTDLMTFVSVWRNLAELNARKGDWNEAWEKVLTCLHLIVISAEQHGTAPKLSRTVSIWRTFWSIEAMARKQLPAGEQYEELITYLDELENELELHRLVDDNRLILADSLFRNVTAEPKLWEMPKMGMVYRYLPQWLMLDEAVYLRALWKAEEKYSLPRYHPDAQFTADDFSKGMRRWHLISKNILPALDSELADNLCREFAWARVARVGLSIQAYHREHGRWPHDLSELDVPTVEDPFTGGPLIYRQQAQGFILYSVGRDFRDDGGIRSDKVGDPHDITWTIGE